MKFVYGVCVLFLPRKICLISLLMPWGSISGFHVGNLMIIFFLAKTSIYIFAPPRPPVKAVPCGREAALTGGRRGAIRGKPNTLGKGGAS